MSLSVAVNRIVRLSVLITCIILTLRIDKLYMYFICKEEEEESDVTVSSCLFLVVVHGLPFFIRLKTNYRPTVCYLSSLESTALTLGVCAKRTIKIGTRICGSVSSMRFKQNLFPIPFPAVIPLSGR